MKYHSIILYKLICIGFIATIVMSGCTRATKTLFLYDARFPAILEPTKNINILKIDKKKVKVNPHKTTETQYYKIALEPGKHIIVVRLPMFDEGSVFFLKAFFIGGREYLVKHKVGKRTSFLKNEWRTYVWIEDASTGEIASSIIKNI